MDTIKVTQDKTIPPRQCVIIIDGKVVYAGRIGIPMVRFMAGNALLVLNPEDFADCEAFTKKHLN